ncbi:hypothetical protein GOPIP_031_02800 [Gordonia polyisoprenivorans NBRC 16320 = JCM 10675]|uniref:Uncharacterized protein n=1 Tax=Gordonia polyisoprenivorans TaxID=84595 RepID=A0A846WH91_9ACTN|nr:MULTISPECIES: hypothetical protein [Gordonia]MDF3283016.1 hypothetical protein [Gordonia sp. N1V]NKY00838.1 hypothetical protein [Gordonia polyisoprenivorans]QUD82319.1 hypothetical protein J8M97_21815 [Gordonia polyisoprenivorans]GAB22658.1 hypothetical protein GOPIP_031_02800 [Gordonia polyisoprenivorans NBRC 16320 = JCM 10675]
MSAIAIVVIGVIVFVALFILIGAIWFAWDSDKRVRAFARSTDLIPGKPSRAPDNWTTATSPEALLHRRVRYAIADVHQNPAIPHDKATLADRDRLDDAVFALDDQLIAAADLDGDDKTDRLQQLEGVVEQLEELPRKLWEAPFEKQREDIEAVTAALLRV